MESNEEIGIKMEEIDHRISSVKASTKTLRERLESTPGLIYERKQIIYATSRKLSGVKKQLALREAIVAKDVSQQKDEDDKPKYGTVALRDGEVQIRLSKDEEYKGLKAQEDKFHDQLEKDKIDLDFLHNFNSNSKRMVDLEIER